jgi:hypothetical protein
MKAVDLMDKSLLAKPYLAEVYIGQLDNSKALKSRKPVRRQFSLNNLQPIGLDRNGVKKDKQSKSKYANKYPTLDPNRPSYY